VNLKIWGICEFENLGNLKILEFWNLRILEFENLSRSFSEDRLCQNLGIFKYWVNRKSNKRIICKKKNKKNHFQIC